MSTCHKKQMWEKSNDSHQVRQKHIWSLTYSLFFPSHPLPNLPSILECTPMSKTCNHSLATTLPLPEISPSATFSLAQNHFPSPSLHL
jgi:hypothetical protein